MRGQIRMVGITPSHVDHGMAWLGRGDHMAICRLSGEWVCAEVPDDDQIVRGRLAFPDDRPVLALAELSTATRRR
jgi:hypothetical protein